MAKLPYAATAIGLISLLLTTSFAISADNQLTTAELSPNSAQVSDSARVQKGRSLFNQTCAHCHGPDAAAGQPERNLKRLRARYGSAMHDVFKSAVTNGRLEKGMPVWGEVLDPGTIDTIYSFLETVQEDSE